MVAAKGRSMTTGTQSGGAAHAGVPPRFYVAGAVLLVGLQVAILQGFGQPLVAASGRIVL